MMIDREQHQRFSRLESSVPGLHQAFNILTSAHAYFQGPGELRSISVSDAFKDGSIEATFNGIRIRFELLLTVDYQQMPLGRVVCTQCHGRNCDAEQTFLGEFTFGAKGDTDFDAAPDGAARRLDNAAPWIILNFLDRALEANRSA
jgi:hypothetical protein